MNERKYFFPLYYFYNLMALILWMLIYRKKCKYRFDKLFSFVLCEADNMESQQVD